MCVAAVIFEPVPLTDLECMETDNPHGGGVAWEDKTTGQIQFFRGLTAREIHDLQTSGAMSYPYLLHFRWATHGGVVDELTHPFPVGPRALLGEVTGHSDKVIIHNGTWQAYTHYAEKHINAGNYDLPEEVIEAGSDTAVAAWLAMWDESILDGVAWATAVAEMRDTMDEHGNPCRTMDITTRGTWSEHDNNWYSNLNWLPTNKWYTSGNYSSTGYSYSKNDQELYERVGVTQPDSAMRTDENAGWERCIKPHGWRSVTAEVCYGENGARERDFRREDAYYVGLYNDICVRPSFYEVWFPEKDHYKPFNVTDKEWNDRFDGKGTFGRGSTTQQSQTTEKDSDASTSTSASGQDAVRQDSHNAAQNSNAVAVGIDSESAADRREFRSFNDYLVAKYGSAAASEILNCFPNQEDSAESAESDPYEALDAAWTKRKITDPDWLHDASVSDPDDLISEDPSTVNSWLAKQMIK